MKKYIPVLKIRFKKSIFIYLLLIAFYAVKAQNTDAQGYITDKQTAKPIENISIEGIFQDYQALSFNALTDSMGFWEFLNIPTEIVYVPFDIVEDQFDVLYNYGNIRFRIKTNRPIQDGKLYNLEGQTLYQLQFEETDQGIFEATWEVDTDLPRQILLFSDGTHFAKIMPLLLPQGGTMLQEVALQKTTGEKKVSSAYQAQRNNNEDELSYLLRLHDPQNNFQPKDTLVNFTKGQMNYLDIAMKEWPEYVLVVKSKDGNGVDLPDTQWQVVDPNNPEEILHGGNTGSNAVDTFSYNPKSLEEFERIIKTSKTEHEDWQSDVRLKPGEVVMVSSNVLKEYLYRSLVKGQDAGADLDSLDVKITDPQDNNAILASVSSLGDKTAIVDFYKSGHEKNVDVEIKRKGYETQNNPENILEGQNNNLTYAMLANRFFGNIKGEKTDGTPLDSLEILVIDTLANDTLAHLFSGNATSVNYDFRKAKEELANRIEIKRNGYFTQTKNGVWIPGENNETMQLEEIPTEEKGNFRAYIKPPLGYSTGKIIIKGLDVTHADTGLIVGPLYYDFSNIPIDSDGITQLKLYAIPTVAPFLTDSTDINIVAGDNGSKFIDVKAIPQQQQLKGKITLGHTGGLFAQGGYDITIHDDLGERIDSMRVTGEEFLMNPLPEKFEGNISVRFPIGDAQGRDTSYYGIYKAPLKIIDVVWPEDTLKTMNMRFTPINMVDPYTGQTVGTSPGHIGLMEGESFSVEFFKHNIENVYLAPNISETWYNGMMDLIENLIGQPLNENRVSTERDITGEIGSNYTLANDNYKDDLGWNMTADGSGNVTVRATIPNNELPIYMHLGGDINFSGDSLAFCKERIGRWLALNDVPSSTYVSFMNENMPSGWSTPDIHDRVKIKEFMENRKGLVDGSASYPLLYLKRASGF